LFLLGVFFLILLLSKYFLDIVSKVFLEHDYFAVLEFDFLTHGFDIAFKLIEDFLYHCIIFMEKSS